MERRFNLEAIFSAFKAWFSQNKYNKYIAICGLVISSYVSREIYWFSYRKYHSLPPTHSGLPLFGLVFEFNGSMTARINLAKRYGPIFYSTRVGYPVVVISSTKLLKQLLVQRQFLNRDKPSPHAADSIFTHGDSAAVNFVSINGEEWKKRRKLAQDTLVKVLNNKKMTELMNQTMQREVVPLLDEMSQSQRVWHPRDILEYIAFNTIYSTLFGEILVRESKLYKALLQDLKNVFKFGLLDVLARNIPLIKYVYGAKLKKLRNDREGRLLRLIQQKTAQQKENEATKSFIDCTHEMVLSGNLSQDQEIADMFLLFAAGTDTTSSTLDFGLALIAKYQDVQNVVREELQTAMQDGTFNLKLIHNCPRFRALVHEIMRISSVAFRGLVHSSFDDYWITLDDGTKYKIPKNTLIISNVDYFHIYGGDDEHWKETDGDRIILENFLTTDDDGQSRFVMNESFLAFGIGKRDCMGRTLAMKEVQFTLGYLMMRYRFRLAKPMGNIVRYRTTNGTTAFLQESPGLSIEKLNGY